jgi:hypothetical protein
VPDLDLVDETFLTVSPKLVAAVFAEPAAWRRYWPDLALRVYADRGDKGLRWTVDGALVGTMEVWLEPVLDGTLLHFFLRADLPPGRRPRTARDRSRELTRRQLAARAISLELKRELENGRRPGCPPDLT